MKKIEKALKRFEEAVRIDAWKGGTHPKDIPYIEKEYKDASNDLLELIRKRINHNE